MGARVPRRRDDRIPFLMTIRSSGMRRKAPRQKKSPLRCPLILLIGFWLAASGLGQNTRGQHAESAGIQKLQARGFNHFYNLEYRRALHDFQTLAHRQPWNSAVWNRVAEARLYLEMYRIGALESQLYGHGNPFLEVPLPKPNPRALAAFYRDNKRALRLAREQIRVHPDDAHAHYNAAAAWALRGSCDFALRKAYFAALHDALHARSQASKAVKLDPGFVDPRLILGVQQFVAGSLPWTEKLLAHFVGYSGSKKKGIAEIQYVAAHGENTRSDALVLLAVIYRREGWNAQAVPILADLSRQYPRNVLFAVELAGAEEAAGQHQAALAQYHAILRRAQAHAAGYQRAPLDKVWYALGHIHWLYSQYLQALHDFLLAAHAPITYPRYRQAAWLAAGQMEDLMGRRPAAVADYRSALARGRHTPAGKAARRFLRHPYRASRK